MKSSSRKFFKLSLVLILWAAALAPFISLYFFLNIANDSSLPGFEELENPKTNLASVIYTSDIELIGKYYQENRTNSNFNDLSPWLIKALVSTEDERYYEHSGIDVKALGRVVKGVLTGNSSQGGGSTISQQVVKNVYLWQDRSWFRKLLEALMTPVVELVWSKERILEVYLNIAEFDEGVFGVGSAAQHYFGVDASQLTATQAARLAAVLPSPKTRSASRPDQALINRASSIADGAATILNDGRAACFTATSG